MSTLYLDTSALVKRYLTELGSHWIRALLNELPMPTVLTSHLTAVEGACTFARRRREGLLAMDEHRQTLVAFDYDLQYQYDVIAVEQEVIDAAGHMANDHPLRAYDAVQLASAWLANQKLMVAERAPLTFVCADDRLIQIAQAVGLLTENPNHHP
jgi:predicted nucleic acid-binding protein